MAHSSLTITYAASDTASGSPSDIWGRLEQEYQPSSADSANIYDLYQMIAMARSGVSAQNYVYDQCQWAVVEDDTIVVSLDFYVWVSSINLPYTLTAGIGVISNPEIVEEFRSFDIPFQGSDSEPMPYIYDGGLVPEMPFISSDGEIINNVSYDIIASTVTLSEPAYCVLRADGKVTGYKHTVTMTLVKPSDQPPDSVLSAASLSTAGISYNQSTYPLSVGSKAVEGVTYTLDFKSSTTFNLIDDSGHTLGSGSTATDFITDYVTVRSDGWVGVGTIDSYMSFVVRSSPGIDPTGYKIENLKNTITLSYTDSGGEVATDVLDLEIPPCVNDLLAACPGGSDKMILKLCEERGCGNGKYVLYVNDCNGEPITVRWEDGA